MAPGRDGTFFVVGSFGSSEPLQVNGVSVASANGSDDIFVARFRSDGSAIWVKSYGGTGADIAFDVDTDANGSAYVTGIATGTVAFDGRSVNAGDGDAVTFKIDGAGQLQWVRTAAGVGNSAGNEIAVRNDGTVAIVGPYTGSTDLGGVTLPSTPSGRDLFVASYEPGGGLRWARSLQGPDAGGSNSEAARGVAFDQSGQRVLVTGVFTASLDLVPRPNEDQSFVGLFRPSQEPGCFVGAFDDNGTADFFRGIGGANPTICRGIVGDSFGQVQVTGKFGGSVFSPPNQLTSNGQEDIFLASVGSSGNVEYSRKIGGPLSEEGAELEEFADGEVILVGDIADGAILPSGVTITTAGSRDILVARFDVSGAQTAFLTAGGTGNEVSFALAVQPDATIGVVGTFGGSTPGSQAAQSTFGSFTLNAGQRPQGAFFAVAGPLPNGQPAAPPPVNPTGLNIAAAAEYARNTNGRGLVVMQNGQMLFEQYANGGSADRAELLASGSKSFSCVYVAAAVRDGIIPNYNVLASTRILSWAPGGSAVNNSFKQQIRVRDLLDLSSGLSNAGASGQGLYTVDSYAQAINVRSSFEPNKQIVYTPNHFQAFLAYFELATGGVLRSDGGVSGGRDPGEYLQSSVLNTIGATIPEWRRDIEGNPILAGGALMTARDWARYGQLVLQNGQWNGQQILPAEIMDQCRTPQSPEAANIYGLGWWLNLPAQNFNPREDSIPLQPGEEERLSSGGQFIPTAPSDLFYARGAGNMKLFIIPSRHIVIARQGGATDDVEFFRLLLGNPTP